MVHLEDNSKCCGCAACVAACPKNCISMKYDEDGFLYPVVNQKDCIDCKRCEQACPFLHPAGRIAYKPRAYGVVAKDDSLVWSSSSGGLFSVLSKKILNQGGCVFGAAFSDDYRNVVQCKTENADQLSEIRGSKYVQSSTQQSFIDAKAELAKGRLVLYSGTPCQIAGLKNFLGREYDKLILVDVICHGTPSVKLWQKYALWQEHYRHGTITSVSFRHKKDGQSSFGTEGTDTNGWYYNSFNRDPYVKMFLKNICLRESCYRCTVKESGSNADITLGDFWGVEGIAPNLDNTKGVSLALIHSPKGQRLFDSVEEEITKQEVLFDIAISKNLPYNHSVLRPQERDLFYRDVDTLSWEELVHRYAKQKITTRWITLIMNSPVGGICRELLRMIGIREESKTNYEYGLFIAFGTRSKRR